jgi:hypothetical protein
MCNMLKICKVLATDFFTPHTQSATYCQQQWLFFSQLFLNPEAPEFCPEGMAAWAPLSSMWRKLMIGAKEQGSITAIAVLLQEVDVLEEGFKQVTAKEDRHVCRNALPGLHMLFPLPALFCIPPATRRNTCHPCFPFPLHMRAVTPGLGVCRH